jgi:hypothetical protein
MKSDALNDQKTDIPLTRTKNMSLEKGANSDKFGKLLMVRSWLRLTRKDPTLQHTAAAASDICLRV